MEAQTISYIHSNSDVGLIMYFHVHSHNPNAVGVSSINQLQIFQEVRG